MSVNLVNLEPATTAEIEAADYSLGYELYRRNQPYESCFTRWQRRGWKDARFGEQVCIVVDAVFANGGDGESADYAIGEVESWGWIQ